MYIHKESPRHCLSIEIKDHKIWKFKPHLCNHHSLKPGHITDDAEVTPYIHNSVAMIRNNKVAIYKAVADNPVGQGLTVPLFLKVKTKFHFTESK